MAKTKDDREVELASIQAERDEAVDGREILQQFLDWCGKHFARVSWFKDGRGEMFVRIRVEHLEVEQAYTDPIQGALEAMALMDARRVRRAVNTGI